MYSANLITGCISSYCPAIHNECAVILNPDSAATGPCVITIRFIIGNQTAVHDESTCITNKNTSAIVCLVPGYCNIIDSNPCTVLDVKGTTANFPNTSLSSFTATNIASSVNCQLAVASNPESTAIG